mgnify:CR=1 FL=1
MKRVLIGCGLVLSLAGPLGAQTPGSCSYAECALRVRAPGFTTPAAIVRGQNDSVMVVLPGFSGRLAPMFPRPDSAYYHALRYDTYRRRAFGLGNDDAAFFAAVMRSGLTSSACIEPDTSTTRTDGCNRRCSNTARNCAGTA